MRSRLTAATIASALAIVAVVALSETPVFTQARAPYRAVVQRWLPGFATPAPATG